MSELCGLTWADAGLEDAEVTFGWQVDRNGDRQPTKTDGSARTVPIPRQLASVLAGHRSRSRYLGRDEYVFSTRTGRRLGQRNVMRALRNAQMKARDPEGDPTFPVLQGDKPSPALR